MIFLSNITLGIGIAGDAEPINSNIIGENLYFNNDIFESDITYKLKKSNVNFSESKLKETNFLFKTKNIKKDDKEILNKEYNSNFPEIYKNFDSYHIEGKKMYIIESKRLSELEDNNLYFTLKVEENSDKECIKRAYKNLCKVCHPDKGGDTSEFNKIRRAYEILSNDICRKLYDRFSSDANNLIDFILSQNDDQFIDIGSSVIENEDLEVIKLLLKQK